MSKLAILIPVYYEVPTRLDILSLKSLNDNLNNIENYTIYFICPEDLKLDNWTSIFNDYLISSIQYDKSYFSSTLSYSKLMMSYEFWKNIGIYEYALIYQTDGYCLGGDIEKFIEMDYDYIGGPIVAQNARWFNVPAVGNGGVSLRKIQTMLDLTNPEGTFLLNCKKNIDRHNNANSNMYEIYEDLYFAQLCPMLWDMKKPDFLTAASFSYDMNTDVVWKMTNGVKPMFCHAFDKNIRFWQNIIPEMQDIDIISDCEAKNKNGYLSYKVGYQKDLEHIEPINVCAIMPVRRENYHLKEVINKLCDQGVSKVIVIDNNKIDAEKVIDIAELDKTEVIDKFRGERYTQYNDLVSRMFNYAYKYYAKDYDYCLFIDADEEFYHEDGYSIRSLCKKMRDENIKVLNISCIVKDINGNTSAYQNNMHKSLVKTNLDISQFTREEPITQYKTKSIDSDKCHINNFITCKSKEEFELYKKHRGYIDMNDVIGRQLTDNNLWNIVNPSYISNSTIEIKGGI